MSLEACSPDILLLLQKPRYQRYHLKQVDRDSSFRVNNNNKMLENVSLMGLDSQVRSPCAPVSADTLETMSSDEAFPPVTT